MTYPSWNKLIRSREKGGNAQRAFQGGTGMWISFRLFTELKGVGNEDDRKMERGSKNADPFGRRRM